MTWSVFCELIYYALYPLLRVGFRRFGLGRLILASSLLSAAIIAVGAPKHAHRLPLSTALVTRVTRFSDAFRRIVFAQFKISAINAVFTAMTSPDTGA